MLYSSDAVSGAYLKACSLDIEVVKPGNVSAHAPGHGMSARDFRESAEATAPIIANRELGLGEAIWQCARLTLDRVGCNTNLGIVLLCVPLARAAMACDTIGDLRCQLNQLLAAATIDDTQGVFDAIGLLSPAGLGESKLHDARQKACAPLLEVMQHGADRDRIAAQYSNGFDDIITFGNRSILRALGSRNQLDRNSIDRNSLSTAVVAVYLDFLCEFPDSHIVRKHGAYMAEAVRDETREKRELYNSLVEHRHKLEFLFEFDRELKFRGINPGTSADLTVATLFVYLVSNQNQRYIE